MIDHDVEDEMSLVGDWLWEVWQEFRDVLNSPVGWILLASLVAINALLWSTI